MAEFLIVDDNRSAADTLCALVGRRGHRARAAYDGASALAIIDESPIDVLVTDLRMPGMDGLTLLGAAREKRPDLVVLVVTAFGSVESAVEAMRLGAFDFVTKPVDPAELQVKLQKAVEMQALARQAERLSARVESFEADDARRRGTGDMVGDSPALRRVLDTIAKVAPTDSTVLIVGESGTGKELAARAIHKNSARTKEPFVSVHCASYAPGVLESELFGHERGAFTGAVSRKIGRFELADKGTFFLDEVGDIPMEIQTKLLRAVQEREFERVGGTQTLRPDIRIVAATNKNLSEAIKDGAFREDLYYRLNIFTIEMPPLRERREDIPALVGAFCAAEARRLGHGVAGPSAAALDALTQYEWPGNIRELRNVIERAAVLAGGEGIEVSHLPSALSPTFRSYVELPETDVDFDAEMERYERQLILHAYERSGGVKAQAAKMLGIDRNRFRYKLEKLGIKDE